MSDTAAKIAADPAPGDWLAGKYRLDSVLGEGGMGIVYDATHVHLERSVAIKVIRAALSDQPTVVTRMIREARTIAQIDNDHVVRVLDVGQLDSGCPFIVMERLKGENLLSVLEREGPLEVSVAISYVLEACVALAEAHSKGIVHRDLKPENLFLARRNDGTSCLKVLDFGIAKQLWTNHDLRQTDASCVLGSPQYMAPEQLRADLDIDARADIWALGVVLYELLTAQLPFEAKSIAETCARVLSREPIAPAELRPDLPCDVNDAILCCLSKDKEQRFSTPLQLAQALAAWGPPNVWAQLDRIARLLGAVEPLPAQDAEAPTLIHSHAPVSRVVERPGVGSTLRLARQGKRQWYSAAAGSIALAALVTGLELWRTPTTGALADTAASAQEPIAVNVEATRLPSLAARTRSPGDPGPGDPATVSGADAWGEKRLAGPGNVSLLVEPVVMVLGPEPRTRAGRRAKRRGQHDLTSAQTPSVEPALEPGPTEAQPSDDQAPVAPAEPASAVLDGVSEADADSFGQQPVVAPSSAEAEPGVDPFDPTNFGGRL